MAHKGKFKPRNPQKYDGDPTKIIYRSSWERTAFRWMDENPDIISWSSEETIIPYLSPVDKKIHRYFPDLLFKIRKGNSIVTYLVEIKPEQQMKPPNPSRRNATPTGRVSTRFLREAATYAVNDAKWAAARKLCEQKGWIFQLWGEKALGIK